MKYFKQYKEPDAKAFEVTKEEARKTLEGHWSNDVLDEIFNEEKPFRLWTPYSVVWTKKRGKVPMAGFYGICG